MSKEITHSCGPLLSSRKSSVLLKLNVSLFASPYLFNKYSLEDAMISQIFAYA